MPLAEDSGIDFSDGSCTRGAAEWALCMPGLFGQAY